MKLAGNHGQSRRTLHEPGCALSGPGPRTPAAPGRTRLNYVGTHGAAGRRHIPGRDNGITRLNGKPGGRSRLAIRHARSNPPRPQSLSVTSGPAAPAATLTSITAIFTPASLTTFLLRWFPRKRHVHS